jgi:hypothetical protein
VCFSNHKWFSFLDSNFHHFNLKNFSWAVYIKTVGEEFWFHFVSDWFFFLFFPVIRILNWGPNTCALPPELHTKYICFLRFFFVCVFVCALLRLELRATVPAFFLWIGSHELFSWAGFKLWSSWSFPLEQVGL